MGYTRAPQPAKLFVGLLSADQSLLAAVRRPLERVFGRADFISPPVDFTHTDYYRAELGEGLVRQFVAFRRPVRQEGIYRAKIVTNRLEDRFSAGGRRRVNIDPGYLTLSKVVLLTTKDFTHRLYLGRGIYAEVTLYYKGGMYTAWPWTYPDYAAAETRAMFNDLRRRLHEEAPSPC